MKRIFSSVSGQVSLLIALSCFLTSFAISRVVWPKETVFATYVNLVVLNVLVMDKQTGQPVQGLRAENFEVFDNGEPTRIAYFRQGPRSDEEPVALWLIAGCGQKGKLVQQQDSHVDAADFLKSALGHLNPEDMVGVAHLCAEKDVAQVDLEPTRDRAAPVIALNSVMHQNAVKSAGQDGGQVAQKVLQLIHAATPSSEQPAYAVAVFLDSDISNASKAEAAQFAGDVLAHTSLVVDEIDEGGVSASKVSSTGRIPLLRYLSQETGGQIISTKGKTVGEALDEIVIGLHSRYVLAFIPPARVEGWHALSVKLSATAMEKHEGTLLSYRSGYRLATWSDLHPVSESPVENGRAFDGALTRALESDTPIGDISFEADGATYEGLAMNAQFSVKLEGELLHWRSQSDSYDRSEITVVIAYFSAHGEILQKELKHYEVARRKEDAWTVRKQTFHFFLLSEIPAKADRIRIVIRDDANGKIGFQDLPVEKVLKAPRIRAVIAKRKATDTLEVARMVPVALTGQQQRGHCSDFLPGLYYGGWDNQGSDLAFVISPDGRPIPPKANDPDAPTKPGFYEGQQRFDFVSSRFSSRVFTFHTVAIDGRAFFFSGRFGCEAVDVIPEVPYLEGELTEMRNAVVRKKKIRFGHAVVL